MSAKELIERLDCSVTVMEKQFKRLMWVPWDDGEDNDVLKLVRKSILAVDEASEALFDTVIMLDNRVTEDGEETENENLQG